MYRFWEDKTVLEIPLQKEMEKRYMEEKNKTLRYWEKKVSENIWRLNNQIIKKMEEDISNCNRSCVYFGKLKFFPSGKKLLSYEDCRVELKNIIASEVRKHWEAKGYEVTVSQAIGW